MDNSINSLNTPAVNTQKTAELSKRPALMPHDYSIQLPKDTLELGKNEKLTTGQSMSVVYERAMDKLRSVVGEAKQALGLPADAVLDTSPEATGGRIADFAIGAFGKWLENHKELLNNKETRQQFADFIGAAVQEGVNQARGILGSLNALSPDVETNINATVDTFQQRLDAFVAGTS